MIEIDRVEVVGSSPFGIIRLSPEPQWFWAFLFYVNNSDRQFFNSVGRIHSVVPSSPAKHVPIVDSYNLILSHSLFRQETNIKERLAKALLEVWSELNMDSDIGLDRLGG